MKPRARRVWAAANTRNEDDDDDDCEMSRKSQKRNFVRRITEYRLLRLSPILKPTGYTKFE